MSLHARVSRTVYLSTATTRIKADDYTGIRRKAVKMARVRLAKGRPPAPCDCGVRSLPLT